MSELEERINSVLNDPQQLQQITKMAQSLMGGSGGNSGQKPDMPGNMQPASDLLSQLGIDGNTIGKINRLLGAQQSASSSSSRALLEAMKPFLSDKRRQKVDKALKIAMLAKLAGLAMGEMEGQGDD